MQEGISIEWSYVHLKESNKRTKTNPFAPTVHFVERRGIQCSSKGEVQEDSPDDTSRYCSGKVIASPGCKQSPGSRGDKNWITITRSSASVKVVKLLRTDTTLDLSQKARVVRNQGVINSLL